MWHHAQARRIHTCRRQTRTAYFYSRLQTLSVRKVPKTVSLAEAAWSQTSVEMISCIYLFFCPDCWFFFFLTSPVCISSAVVALRMLTRGLLVAPLWSTPNADKWYLSVRYLQMLVGLWLSKWAPRCLVLSLGQKKFFNLNVKSHKVASVFISLSVNVLWLFNFWLLRCSLWLKVASNDPSTTIGLRP